MPKGVPGPSSCPWGGCLLWEGPPLPRGAGRREGALLLPLNVTGERKVPQRLVDGPESPNRSVHKSEGKSGKQRADGETAEGHRLNVHTAVIRFVIGVTTKYLWSGGLIYFLQLSLLTTCVLFHLS